MRAVCPFGRYCQYLTNKKWQPNPVCYHFFMEKCSEKKKLYEKTPTPTPKIKAVKVSDLRTRTSGDAFKEEGSQGG